MPRIRIGKQTELSAANYSIVLTDASNEQMYYAPGANGTVLTVSAGIPTWVAPTAAVLNVIADGGSNPAVTLSSENLSILGGLGIDTTGNSGADSITIALNAFLDDLSDVSAPAPTVGQNLQFDGVNWVAADPLQFGEYQTTFDASGGVFPGGGGIIAADWFNTTVAGVVDGQSFSIGDILIAIVDTPSNVTFAGNWVKISPIGSFSQFFVSADIGASETILNNNTLNFIGGTNITTTVSASDNVTFDWAADLDDLSDVAAPAPVVNDVLSWDGANWVNNSIPNLETTTTIAGALGAGNIIGTYTNEDAVAVILRETITTLAGTLGAGNTIGTYTNEGGAAVILRETVTDFLLSGSNLRYVDEAGVNNDVAISTLISTDGGNATTVGTDGKLYVSAGAVVANLSLANITANTLDVNIDTGTDVTLPAVTTTTAGVMTADFLNDLLDLITLTGVAGNSVNLATFTGITIPDNVTIKAALQALETDLELQNLRFDILDEGIDTGAGEITSINFVGAGVVATQAGNAVTVTIAGADTTTVSDTNTVDLTLAGVNISADVLFSATAGNVSHDVTGVAVLPRTEYFTPANLDTTVTLATAPLAGTPVHVYINGERAPITTEWSIAGTTITFVTAFAASPGAQYSGSVAVDYWI